MTDISFHELQLAPPILRALEAEDYTTPTPIQAAAIPHVLAGRDLLGCAQTGTGKTAAFALPILQRIAESPKQAASRAPQVLILSPTRELAVQIDESFRVYGRNVRFRRLAIFGGVGQGPQVRALDRGVHVLVATPGRLLDLMNQGCVRLDEVQTLVLDEADRMLDMGFLPDLNRIIARLPEERQSLFFSATMPPTILALARRLLTDPIRVSVTPPASTVELIDQRVLFVESKDKRALLCRILGEKNHERALIFTRTKHGADRLVRQLAQNGHPAAAMHGSKSQSARQLALRRFRDGNLRVLVATDLAARGLDVDGVSHVINFDLPHEPESYVHRIGRTGRAGASGIALSFCETKDHGSLRAIEKLVRHAIQVETDHPFHKAHAQISRSHVSPAASERSAGKSRHSARRRFKRNRSATAQRPGGRPGNR